MIDESWYKRSPGVWDRTSAGGVVVRIEDGEAYVALVEEIGLTSRVFPKGGVEPGESFEEAARREIEEEAVITSLELVEKPGIRERFSYDRDCWITTLFFSLSGSRWKVFQPTLNTIRRLHGIQSMRCRRYSSQNSTN